ncbi:unnamed protein product, partial [marine sediment metagenome]
EISKIKIGMVKNYSYTARVFLPKNLIKFICFTKENSLVSKTIGHTKEITCLDISPNSKYIATGSEDGTIKFWEFYTGNLVRTLTCQPKLQQIKFTFNNDYLVSFGESRIKIWETMSGKLHRTLEISNLVTASLSPNNLNIICCLDNGNLDIINLMSGEVIQTTKTPKLSCITTSYDGSYIIAGANSGDIFIWKR